MYDFRQMKIGDLFHKEMITPLDRAPYPGLCSVLPSLVLELKGQAGGDRVRDYKQYAIRLDSGHVCYAGMDSDGLIVCDIAGVGTAHEFTLPVYASLQTAYERACWRAQELNWQVVPFRSLGELLITTYSRLILVRYDNGCLVNVEGF